MRSNRRAFLGLCAAGTGGLVAGCTATPWERGDSGKVDDWQYTPSDDSPSSLVSLGGSDDVVAESAPADADESIGLAAGGAADVGTFRRNVSEGYLPIPESMAYEGLFGEYYFDTGGDGSCDSLFCPTYTPAVSPDPLSGEAREYLSVGLDSGLSQSEFERPPLNLVVVLDISGSMRASFAEYYYGVNGGEYYYDEHGNRQEPDGGTDRPKMDVAKDALVDLTHHLQPEDRLGVVLFNHEAHLAKPLRLVEETDMDAIRGHIQEDVLATGGTNISDAMATSQDLMSEYADPGEYENRSILLTDAQINWGETDADEIRSSLEENADEGHHTSVVGIGVDFNADLIGQITGVRGGNYYSIYTEDEFEQRMDQEFEYMVTPLVYDLSLELDADGYEIARVYGTNAPDEATGELMHVPSLFPSPREDGEARGGVVLVEIEETGENGGADVDLALEASWETRDGTQDSTVETISFPREDETYGNDAVRKALLLAQYADLLRNWTVYEREETLVEDDDGIAEPPSDDRLSEWELQSEPLVVSERYDSRIGSFREHFESEKAAIGDEELAQELELMDAILAAESGED